MASTTFEGPVTSVQGFVGAVTGAITGNVTGNVTGNLTGNVSGLAGTGEAPVLAVATVDATAAAITMTAAQFLSGLLLRDPAGANRADVVPTAANLLAALPASARVVGSAFEFTIRNTADAAETITVTADAGPTATLSGTMTIAQNNSKRFRVVFTNVTAASEAYTLYSLGTVVH